MKKSRARGRRGHGDDRLSPKDPIEPAGAARDALGELRVTYAQVLLALLLLGAVPARVQARQRQHLGRRGGAIAAAIRLACGLAGAERRSRGGEVASSGFARDRTRPYVHRRCMSPYVSRDQRGAATPGRSAAGHG